MNKNRFRAWDTKRSTMWSADELGGDQLTLSPDGKGFVNVHSVHPHLSQYYYHLIPLQSTGMSDKNGTEIFEGDIIIYKSAYSSIRWNGTVGGFVVFNNQQLGREAVMYEVVGNIYENEDFLLVWYELL